MTRETVEVLAAFDALSDEDKRAFTAAFLLRAIPFDSGPLGDEETTKAADEMFAGLDTSEDDIISRLCPRKLAR